MNLPDPADNVDALIASREERRKAERKRFDVKPGQRCRHCGLGIYSHHPPELYCPEWALRASDGDR